MKPELTSNNSGLNIAISIAPGTVLQYDFRRDEVVYHSPKWSFEATISRLDCFGIRLRLIDFTQDNLDKIAEHLYLYEEKYMSHRPSDRGVRKIEANVSP